MSEENSLDQTNHSDLIGISPIKSIQSNKSIDHHNHNINITCRVRSYQQYEIINNSNRIISTNDNKLVIVNPNAFDADPDDIAVGASIFQLNDCSNVFKFDDCIWSYNNDNKLPIYHNQDDVYKKIGLPLVDNILNNVSCVCFTYGPTGTGKSYTLFGSLSSESSELTEDNRIYTIPIDFGLIPRVFCDIVNSFLSANKFFTHNITISFIEIYNDKIKDLLVIEPEQTDKDSLRIREHAIWGQYIENLTKAEVNSVNDVIEILTIGYNKRNNNKSSKIHTVVTLEITSKDVIDPTLPRNVIIKSGYKANQKTIVDSSKCPYVRIQMIELAGSEKNNDINISNIKKYKAFSSYSTDDIINKHDNNIEKLESKYIRQTLSTLGNIVRNINKMTSSNHKINITTLPYRESLLTLYLKDILNEKTYTNFILTISPSNLHYEETLLTLKYGERLKSMKSLNHSWEPVNKSDQLDQSVSIASPGSVGAKYLFRETITDPQQRIAKLKSTNDILSTPLKSVNNSNIYTPLTNNHYNQLNNSFNSHITNPLSSYKSNYNSLGVLEDDNINNYEDLKDVYRSLRGQYIELQIELQNAKTDRDTLLLELRQTKEALEDMQTNNPYIGNKTLIDDMSATINISDKDINELKNILIRKEEKIDRLLGDLADERHAKNTLEQINKTELLKYMNEIDSIQQKQVLLQREIDKYKQENELLNEDRNQLILKYDQLNTSYNDILQQSSSNLQSINILSNQNNQLKQQINDIINIKDTIEINLNNTLDILNNTRFDLEIVTKENNSLKQLIQQKDSTIELLNNNTSNTMKLLANKQIIINTLDITKNSFNNEINTLYEYIDKLFISTSNDLSYDIIDINNLNNILTVINNKLNNSNQLNEQINQLTNEKNELVNELNYIKEFLKSIPIDKLTNNAVTNTPTINTSNSDINNSIIIQQINELKQLIESIDIKSNYWQNVISKLNTNLPNNQTNKTNYDQVVTEKNSEIAKLANENKKLSDKVIELTVDNKLLNEELKTTKDSIQNEFSNLWSTINELNKLDILKDKELSNIIIEKDNAIKERDQLLSKYNQLSNAYFELQDELKAIDNDLLAVAEAENIQILRYDTRKRIKGLIYDHNNILSQPSNHLTTKHDIPNRVYNNTKRSNSYVNNDNSNQLPSELSMRRQETVSNDKSINSNKKEKSNPLINFQDENITESILIKQIETLSEFLNEDKSKLKNQQRRNNSRNLIKNL